MKKFHAWLVAGAVLLCLTRPEGAHGQTVTPSPSPSATPTHSPSPTPGGDPVFLADSHVMTHPFFNEYKPDFRIQLMGYGHETNELITSRVYDKSVVYSGVRCLQVEFRKDLDNNWNTLWLASDIFGAVWMLRRETFSQGRLVAAIDYSDKPWLFLPADVTTAGLWNSGLGFTWRVTQTGYTIPSSHGYGPFPGGLVVERKETAGGDIDTEYWAPGLWDVREQWNDGGETGGYTVSDIRLILPTPTYTVTATPSPTLSPTITPTFTISPTPTETATETPVFKTVRGILRQYTGSGPAGCEGGLYIGDVLIDVPCSLPYDFPAYLGWVVEAYGVIDLCSATGERICIQDFFPEYAVPDFDSDGKVTQEDLLYFLRERFSQDSGSDLNKDGAVGYKDIFVFSLWWQ